MGLGLCLTNWWPVTSWGRPIAITTAGRRLSILARPGRLGLLAVAVLGIRGEVWGVHAVTYPLWGMLGPGSSDGRAGGWPGSGWEYRAPILILPQIHAIRATAPLRAVPRTSRRTLVIWLLRSRRAPPVVVAAATVAAKFDGEVSVGRVGRAGGAVCAECFTALLGEGSVPRVGGTIEQAWALGGLAVLVTS